MNPEFTPKARRAGLRLGAARHAPRRRTTRASAIPAARHTATAALGHGAAVEAHGGEQAAAEIRAAAEDVVDVGLVPKGRNFIITLVFNYKYMRFIVITILFLIKSSTKLSRTHADTKKVAPLYWGSHHVD